jgi:hypothetical protein
MAAEIEGAFEQQRQGGWITYLIRDPSRPDLKGNPAGWPIYIGQTKQFGVRVRGRFMECERNATVRDTIERRVADCLHQGVVVHYEVLERVATRLQSLLSETNWVKRCRNRGYGLVNQWAEQKTGGDLLGPDQIPAQRIWPFTLGEAVEDGIDLELRCRRCDLSHTFDLSRLCDLPAPPRTLADVRDNQEIAEGICTLCGGERTRYVKLHVPLDQLTASRSPQPSSASSSSSSNT